MHLISTFAFFVVPYLQTKEEQPKHQLPQAGEESRGEEVSFLCQLGLVGRTGTWRWWNVGPTNVVVGLLDGWVVGNLQRLVSDHCFVGKVIRPGQSFWMVGGRSLGGAWMRLPRPLPGIPPPCLPTILPSPPCLPNLPTLLWPHNHHPTHSKPPCHPCQAGMDFPEQNSKTSKF